MSHGLVVVVVVVVVVAAAATAVVVVVVVVLVVAVVTRAPKTAMNENVCKRGEFTTSRNIPFGVPQSLPDMDKVTASLCGQQRRVLWKSQKKVLL